MPVTIPNTFTGASTATGAQFDANFNALKAKFSAGIVNGDINGSAGISADKIQTVQAQIDYEVPIYCKVSSGLTTISGFTNLSEADTATASLHGLLPLDYDGSTTAVEYHFFTNQPGNSDGVVELLWGYLNGAQVFQTTTELVTGIAIDGYAKTGSISKVLADPGGSNVGMFAVNVTTTATGTTNLEQLVFSIRLRRTFDSTNTG